MVAARQTESRFDEPMPWIGIYVAGAALACGIAMTMDALHGFRYKKFWFLDKFFTLWTPLEGHSCLTQLAKVSSSTFICAVMGNLLPSLGTMKNNELFVNVVALAILVITAVVNICIQMSTELFLYFGYNMLSYALILFYLQIACSYLWPIPTTKVRFRKVLDTGIFIWSSIRNRTLSTVHSLRWSTTMVLISQTIAVGIGTISPKVRWFMAINFSCRKKAKKARGRTDRCPPGRKVMNKEATSVANEAVRLKHLWFTSIALVGRFLDFKRFIKGQNSISNNDSEVGSQHSPDTNLNSFVIHLDGEDELVDLMMKNNDDATAHWINIGEKQKPKNLIELLEKVDSSLSFTGVKDFDSDKKVPPPSNRLNSMGWLEVDLNEMALQEKGIKETIKALSDISKENFTEYAETHFIHMNEWFLEEDPSRLCIRMLAANSMYRISCFTKLQHVISNNAVKVGLRKESRISGMQFYLENRGII
ncbi:hypothetical protein Tco_1093762 [Tanacetum coccineum]|uniref:Uncharacterized protein n=1 Tax=Tanacetum coccineum TaxID=301880 RepID=A0ABQ5IDN1_9ASTR